MMLDIPNPKNFNGNHTDGLDEVHILNKLSSNDRNKKKNLEKLLETRRKIAEKIKTEIFFSNPILQQNGKPVFFPKTINVIQGKAGVHKSRLAETICSALLLRSESSQQLLQFKANMFLNFTVCYVDTERNHSDQLPFALQQIKRKAGYSIKEDVSHFDYISLLEFDREERFETLESYLEYVRSQYSNHIFIVLDVVTDCTSSFNDTKDSMKLVDMMNKAINQHDVTFLCIIHENPGSTDKARGHLGTEIMNKASTVIQVGYEKDHENVPMDLIKISYLKCRSSKRHDPVYAQYSETDKGLVIASPEKVREALDRKKQKVSLESLIEVLGNLLDQPLSRSDLLFKLVEEFDCGKRILEERLKQIIDSEMPLKTSANTLCRLRKERQEHTIVYSLEPVSE